MESVADFANLLSEDADESMIERLSAGVRQQRIDKPAREEANQPTENEEHPRAEARRREVSDDASGQKPEQKAPHQVCVICPHDALKEVRHASPSMVAASRSERVEKQTSIYHADR
jgi:hypothetical protein